MSIKLALLDLGNVLVKVDFREFAERAATGSARSANEILERYDKGERKKQLERGQLTVAEFFAEMAEWLERPGAETELKGAWQSVFSPMPGVEAALSQIEQMCPFWILSDTDPLHLSYLREHYPLINRVERFWASFETGLRKTDTRIFEKIFAEASCPPAEIFFTDDKSEHVKLAKQVGMTAVVFTDWPNLLKTMNVSNQ